MKAVTDIWIPNFRAFEKGILKPSMDSSFLVKSGQDVEKVMLEHELTSAEVAEIKVKILKGNPHWVSLETKEEVKKLEEVKEEKEKSSKRKEELKLLKKDKQVELLKKLGVKEKEIPHFEVDRVELIVKLESN